MLKEKTEHLNCSKQGSVQNIGHHLMPKVITSYLINLPQSRKGLLECTLSVSLYVCNIFLSASYLSHPLKDFHKTTVWNYSGPYWKLMLLVKLCNSLLIKWLLNLAQKFSSVGTEICAEGMIRAFWLKVKVTHEGNMPWVTSAILKVTALIKCQKILFIHVSRRLFIVHLQLLGLFSLFYWNNMCFFLTRKGYKIT